MYYFMFVLGFIFLVFYNYNFYHIYGTSRKRALWYSLTFIYGMLGANAMGRIYTAVCAANNIDEFSRLAIFGAVLFAPVLIILTAIIEKLFRGENIFNRKPAKKSGEKSKQASKVRIGNTLDMLTPGLFTTIALGKTGCMLEGCCFGIECSIGVYSDKINATVFPVQLFESIVLFIILALCFFLKRKRFYRRGMAYPLTALLYCCQRFCVEFLRYYTDELRHMVFGMTLWQFLSIIVIAVSAVSLAVIYKRGESDPLPRLTFSASKGK